MEGFNVKIKLKTLTCHDRNENQSKVTPYLWTIFFKIDGNSVIIANDFKLVGKGVFHYGKESHGNLNVSNIEKGQTISIPADVGEWSTYMEPFVIPYFDQKVPSMIGAICVLMEQNNVSKNGAEAGHQALNQQVELAVNQSLADFDPKNVDINDVMGSIKKYFETQVADFTDSIKDDIIKAIKKKQNIFQNLWTLWDADNMLGHQVWNFNQKDILENKTQSIDFGNRWKAEDNHGEWEIEGNISIIKHVIPNKESLEETETKALNHTEDFAKKVEIIEKESDSDNDILEISN